MSTPWASLSSFQFLANTGETAAGFGGCELSGDQESQGSILHGGETEGRTY